MYRKMLMMFISTIAVVTTVFSHRVSILAYSGNKIIICSLKNQCSKENIKLGECEYTVPIEGAVFKIFKIDKNESENLDSYNIEEFENRFGKGITTEQTGKDGVVKVSKIESGEYCVVQVEKVDGKYIKKRNIPVSIVKANGQKDNVVYTKQGGKDYSDLEISSRMKPEELKRETKKKENKIEENKIVDIDREKNRTKKVTQIDKLCKKNSELKTKGKNSDEESNTEEKIIKTGDIKIFYILGTGIIVMALGYRSYKIAC